MWTNYIFSCWILLGLCLNTRHPCLPDGISASLMPVSVFTCYLNTLSRTTDHCDPLLHIEFLTVEICGHHSVPSDAW